MEHTMPIGVRFSVLNRAFKKCMDDRMKQKDITGVQFGTLAELLRMEHHGKSEIRQRDLENAVHVTHPTMTEIIKRLESKGFLQCHEGRKDRRSKCICSTRKAEALLQEVHEVIETEIFREMTAGLTEEQKQELLSITELMARNALQVLGCPTENFRKGTENHDETTDKKCKGV